METKIANPVAVQQQKFALVVPVAVQKQTSALVVKSGIKAGPPLKVYQPR